MLVFDYIKLYKEPDLMAKNLHKPKAAILVSVHSTNLELIKRSITSALQQTLHEIEIIIADCSGDDTVYVTVSDLIKENINVTYFRCRKKDNNVAIPYYMALQYSSAEYIAMLPEFCVWKLDYIEHIRNYMVANELMVSYGKASCSIVHRNSKHHIATYGGFNNIQDLASHNILLEGSVMFRRTVLKDVGFLCPHFFIQNYCLWDFYQRLAKKYLFAASGVTAGISLPPDRYLHKNDSTPKWLVCEFMELLLADQLLADKYTTYDMDKCPDGASKFLVDAIPESYENGKGRDIYRILVLVPSTITACVTLYEERLKIENCIVRVLVHENACFSELVYANMVIVVRELFNIQRWLDISARLCIPVYFFADNNFIVLRSEYPSEIIYNQYTIRAVQGQLKQFTGGLFSTQELLNYFKENQLHKNVSLFEPIMGEWFYKRISDNNNYITISYMGELARASSVKKYILPVLKKVSEKIIVRFICPSFIDTEGYQSDRLEVYKVCSTNSLDQIIIDFARNNIDIQLHCAVDHSENNKFETINALMNAVQVGACLIASNTYPYNDVEDAHNLYALSENTVEDWFENILRLSLDSAERKKLYDNALSYCIKRFNGHYISEYIGSILKKNSIVTTQILNERYLLLKENKIAHPNSLNINNLSKPLWVYNTYNDSLLQFLNLTTGPKIQYLEYTVKVVGNFSYFAIGISLPQDEYIGSAVLNIYSNSNRFFILRSVRVELSTVQDDNLLAFTFPPIDCHSSTLLFIEILFYTTKPYISVYEYRHSFFKRILAKLLPFMKRPIYYITK